MPSDPTAAARPLPQYAFSSGYAGWWSTVWRILRFSDGHVLATGRTFGRRHEQRAWEQMQRVAEEQGYAN